jgi:hypothetical protein
MTDAPGGPGSLAEPAEDWFESEESTRIAMVGELQRIKRRTRVRPLPVLLLAALITTGITRKFATKPVMVEASVTLALAEGAMANRYTAIPVDQLRQYVTSVLLPDNKLLELIEKRNLSRLRKTMGPQFAIEELRGNLTVNIWKNSFIFFDTEDQTSRRSARIGLAVSDVDPDRAFDIAHDLASIVIQTSAKQRQKLADEISDQVSVLRNAINDKLDKLSEEISHKQTAADEAIRSGRPEVAGVIQLDLAALDREKKSAEDRLGLIESSNEEIASQITSAGLDMSLSIVEEYRPERPARSSFVLILIASVIGAGALLGSALVLGTFDSRVHDSDDVTRLGLPILGHIPGFTGDNVGSMQTRSAARARVPSFLRWRSHR